MSRPASPAGAPPSTRPQPFSTHDLSDPEIVLTSPLSPPLPIPPPPSRSYTDELTKKSVPVDATPVIRLLAPTPEATSPRILLRPRRAGFVDEDDEEPFPSFFHPSLPAGRFDGSDSGASAGLPDPVPWTDELTRQRRPRQPSYAQSVWEEDTSSSSSSSSSAMSSDDETGEVTQRATVLTDGDAEQMATTRRVENRAEAKDGVEGEGNAKSGSSAAQDITTFRFPGATA